MDLTTTLTKKPKGHNKKALLVFPGILLASLLLWGAVLINNKAQVEVTSLRIAEVKQGDFTIDVDGYGRLKAKYQRLLTSRTQAMVEKILLYPGAKVTKESVIMILSDPQLEQAMVTAKLELARQNAELNQQMIAHKSQLLEHDAQMALLLSELETAELRAEAEQQLIDKGIVSALDFKRSQLIVKQLKRRVEIEKARKVHLKAMQIERVKINQDLITQYQLNFKSIKKRFDGLTVRAGLAGILQSMPVEIGQSLSAGTQLAMIGSDQKLVAQLRIPQNQADQIAIGMSASVITSGNNITAQVIRIEPVVTDGRVMIELDLTGKLPANARPELTVEGKIHVNQISDALYIEQPNNVYSFKKKDLFKLTSDAQTAQLTPMEFGTLSGNQIVVVNGAQRGDKLIVSDMSQWQKTQQILLIN